MVRKSEGSFKVGNKFVVKEGINVRMPNTK
jgi:hypothetical protein